MFVVCVRLTFDDPSCCFVVVSFVSVDTLSPVSVVVVDWVRVVVVERGTGLLAQAAAASTSTRIKGYMPASHASAGPPSALDR